MKYLVPVYRFEVSATLERTLELGGLAEILVGAVAEGIDSLESLTMELALPLPLVAEAVAQLAEAGAVGISPAGTLVAGGGDLSRHPLAQRRQVSLTVLYESFSGHVFGTGVLCRSRQALSQDGIRGVELPGRHGIEPAVSRLLRFLRTRPGETVAHSSYQRVNNLVRVIDHDPTTGEFGNVPAAWDRFETEAAEWIARTGLRRGLGKPVRPRERPPPPSRELARLTCRGDEVDLLYGAAHLAQLQAQLAEATVGTHVLVVAVPSALDTTSPLTAILDHALEAGATLTLLVGPSAGEAQRTAAEDFRRRWRHRGALVATLPESGTLDASLVCVVGVEVRRSWACIGAYDWFSPHDAGLSVATTALDVIQAVSLAACDLGPMAADPGIKARWLALPRHIARAARSGGRAAQLAARAGVEETPQVQIALARDADQSSLTYEVVQRGRQELMVLAAEPDGAGTWWHPFVRVDTDVQLVPAVQPGTGSALAADRSHLLLGGFASHHADEDVRSPGLSVFVDGVGDRLATISGFPAELPMLDHAVSDLPWT